MEVFSQNKNFRPTVGKSPKRRRWTYLLVIIIAMALFFGFLEYPGAWDKAADYVNWKLKLEFYKIPHIWKMPFRLGLDLQGGTHLVYRADLSGLKDTNPSSAMDGLRDVIERRTNLFGVAEPQISVNKVGEDWRLIVELAGIKDVGEAIKMIGETPLLEFREERDVSERDQILEKTLGKETADKIKDQICLNPQILTAYLQSYPSALLDPCYIQTQLNGKYLKNAGLNFDSTTYKPVVNLEFNDEGTQLFADITERNVGKLLAIYLDGAPIEIPRVNEKIPSGKAQISGGFTTEVAKKLVERLNAGALPVPIILISQQTVGASLGADSLAKSIKAGMLGFLFVAIFMVMFYRLPGFFSVLALLIYVSAVLIIFKAIPVTLTLAGIAGFILSIGMAVDANILIFERTKEELRSGRQLSSAVEEGFSRAWSSIRDSNISTIITCVVLYTFATSIIKGFALTLLIGVVVSMFSAIFVTRTFLRVFMGRRLENKLWLFGARMKKNAQ